MNKYLCFLVFCIVVLCSILILLGGVCGSKSAELEQWKEQYDSLLQEHDKLKSELEATKSQCSYAWEQYSFWYNESWFWQQKAYTYYQQASRCRELIAYYADLYGRSDWRP